MSISARRLLWVTPLLLGGCDNDRAIGGAMVGAALPVAVGATALFGAISRIDRPRLAAPWRAHGAMLLGIAAMLGIGAAIHLSWVAEGLMEAMMPVSALALWPWLVGLWLAARRLDRARALLYPVGFVGLIWQLPALVCMAGAEAVCAAHQAPFLETLAMWEDHSLLLLVGSGALLLGEALWSRGRAPVVPRAP